MTRHFARALLALTILVAGLAWAQPERATPEALAALQAQREALFDASGLDVQQLSRDIGLAVREAEQLEREGRFQPALDRLKTLERYLPLRDFPSFDVHMLSSWLFEKLGQPEASRHHRGRATAYRELLWDRLGKGDTPEDPLRVVMTHEALEWAKSRLARVTDVKPLPGRGITALTYIGPTAGGAPGTLYVQVDARTRAIINRTLEAFRRIPLAEMPPEGPRLLALAREKRERFLADHSFDYMDLEDRIRTLMDASTRLDMDGKPQEALAKLRELEQVRPIAEIPTPRLLGWYSYLLGRNGQTVLQQEMRGLIFGVQQAMAHSGDASSVASAVEVVLLEDAYHWMRDKKVKLVRQELLERDGQRYDLMTVEDAQGRRSEMFFNVSKLYERRFAPVVPLAGFDRVWSEAERQYSAAPARDYVKRYINGTWNDRGAQRLVQWPADKAIAECVTAIFPGPERVRLAFQLDADGVVQQAHTDQAGFVDECVKTRTAGLRMPAPPSAPFLLCTRFEKSGADRTLRASCGPAPITQDCQRQGNSTRCRVQER